MTEAAQNPVLRTEGLTKSFGALKASNNVSLTLYPGEIRALIGPNGAGKSTLIKQISGGLTPDSGRIEVLGQDVTALDTVARARLGLGRTFQISSLAMEFTVLQNAVLGALGARGNAFSFFCNVMKDAELLARAERLLDQERFDIVVSDVVLTDGYGPDLVERRAAALPVIYTSGWIGEARQQLNLERKDRTFLAKPYRPSALLAALKQLLDLARDPPTEE